MGGRKPKVIKTEEEPKIGKPEEGKKPEAPKEKRAKKVSVPKKVRGKLYTSAKGKLEARVYPLTEAIAKVKELSYASFDASVDAHIVLGLEKGKAEHQIRTFVSLPHGTGKTLKVLAFVEEGQEAKVKEAGADQIGDASLIEKIAQTGAVAYDAVLATPSWMPKLAKVARFLGPKGLMPTPKNGTVTTDPVKGVAELKRGRVEIKTENQPLVHLSIGKVSFPDADLAENLRSVLAELQRVRPAKAGGDYLTSLALAPTMGPSVRVDLATV